MKILIITSYIEHPYSLSESAAASDYIICADGGYDIAKGLGIKPDLLLGDFDSINLDVAGIPDDIEISKFPPEKDYTDLELAINKAMEIAGSRDFSASLEPSPLQIEIAGGIGGRLDHTIANIQLLSAYSNERTFLTLRDGNNFCFVLNGNCGEYSPMYCASQHNSVVNSSCDLTPVISNSTAEIPMQKDSYISIFSLSEACSGVTFEGVKYPLHNHRLTNTYPLGVSNEFISEKATLHVEDGSLLVIISKRL